VYTLLKHQTITTNKQKSLLQLPTYSLAFSSVQPCLLHYVTLAGGVEKEPIDVTYTLSYVAGGRGKEPEYVSAGPAPSSTFGSLYDESLRDTVRLTFQSYIKLTQWLHFCTVILSVKYRLLLPALLESTKFKL